MTRSSRRWWQRSSPASIRTRNLARERAWIALRGTERLGCIFCVTTNAETAKLRLFLIVPTARGTGLGRRFLRECLGYARARSYCCMVSWTHASHRAARALSPAEGFRIVEEAPTRAFGQKVIDLTWEIAL